MSQTKIVVIPLKKLLIGAVIAAIVIAFVIFAVIRLGSKGSDNSRNTSQPRSSTVNASASSNIETPLDNADAPKYRESYEMLKRKLTLSDEYLETREE